MRLIDADDLLNKWNELSSRGRTEFDQIIMGEPTAYDVDIVVKQLKEQEGVCISCRHKDECNECAIGDRIVIIRAGGSNPLN